MKSPLIEFFPLYRNVWKYLLQNISGIQDEASKKGFVNSFLLQMLLLWFIQRKKFFNEDRNYFITKFKEITTKNSPFTNYFEFLIYFLKEINLNKRNRYFNNKITGKIVIPEPLILFNFENNLNGILIPDQCFYDEAVNQSIDYLSSATRIRDFPLFNVFNNHIVNFNGFILSGIYENFITQVEKKNLGTYYTPETITSYICETTINSYLCDEVNAKFSSNFETISSIIDSHDLRKTTYLLLKIQDLRILDPAVGTAHFLESAIKKLVEIYEQIWKDSEKKSLIKSLRDEKAREIYSFLKISDKKDFKFAITHFILSNNIFGVDTNPDVLMIARARLYLLLIENFEYRDKFLEEIPVIDLNLKEGNTLLGYTEYKRDRSTRQMKLESYLTKNNIKANQKPILIDKVLLEYLEKSARVLKIEGQIEKEIDDLNLIFLQDEIDELSIKKVSRTKRKLNRILQSSTVITVQLQDLLSRITALLNTSLDQKFSKEHSISLTQLKKVKTFHWISEFPEIFLQGGGFNIILANPPYLGESGNKELFRIYAKTLPGYYEGKMDLWYLFLQRGLDLLTPNAFSSFITSSYWITATGASRLRARILSDTYIIQYINFGENKVFNTAQGVHINLITFKKAKKANENIKCILFETTYPQGTDLIKKIAHEKNFVMNQKELVFENWDRYFHFLPKNIRLIIEQIIKNSTSLKTSGFYAKEGIVTGLNNITGRQIRKYGLPDEWAGLGVFILNSENLQDLNVIESFSPEERTHLKNFYKNSDISRYHTAVQTEKSILYLNRNTVNLDLCLKIKTHLQKFQHILRESLDNPPYINRPRSQNIFISPKIVTPQRSLKNAFAYNSYDWYAAQDVYYILNERNNKEKLKNLLLILNSQLAYFWFFWMGKRKGNHLELFGEPLSYFPIPNDLKVTGLFTEICHYLLFLHSIKSKEKRFQQMVSYFETQIADSLVYELYLEESIQKNANHKLNFSLLDILSRKINPIEFDKWEMLYHKEKSEGGLSYDEKDQLENLKICNLEIIERCFTALRNNKQIEDLIYRIKASICVNTIEEGF